MIAQAPGIAYIHEPFHIHHSPGICMANFKYWFTYVSTENESNFIDALRRTIALKYNILEEIKLNGFGDWKRITYEYIKFLIFRSLSFRPLIKDPLAIFSAPWLSSKFDMDVVVLIRHPAAFIGSLKRMNWNHPFAHFLNQPLLMQYYLSPFEENIRKVIKEDNDIIDAGSLLWNIIHYMIRKFQLNHPNWEFVRHEDISRYPFEYFRYLFDRLGLEITRDIKSLIYNYSRPQNLNESFNNRYSIKRNSKENIFAWKRRLSTVEINRIRKNTEEVSSLFYTSSDW